jgi:hypothetical protein
MESLGLCLAGWTAKLGKECGRPLTNGSGRPCLPQEEYINGPETKAASIEKYGNIRHPSIGDAVRLILAFCARGGHKFKDICIWKFDLKAAYTKLSYAVSEARYIGVELREGVFMFFLGGVFGLTSMPFAFDVVTRAIVWEMNNRILQDAMLQYVDDGLVVSLRTHRYTDLLATKTFVKDLMGPDAIAEHKTECSLDRDDDLDFTGWNISLLHSQVSMARRNCLKAMYEFASVDLTPNAAVPVKTMQCLASLGSRYSLVCKLMKPYVRPLYNSYAGRSHLHSVILLPIARLVIRLLRLLFAMSAIHPTQFARPMWAFTLCSPRWACEFDASLTGIGVIWFEQLPGGGERAAAYTAMDITSLGFAGRPEFQNLSEYIASLVCVQGLVAMGVAAQPFMMRGDSETALQWVIKGSVKSDRAMRAAMLWAQSAVHHHLMITGTLHLEAALNTRTDALSRNRPWSDVLMEDRKLFGAAAQLRRDVHRLELTSTTLLELCNPHLTINTEDKFTAFFTSCQNFLKADPRALP